MVKFDRAGAKRLLSRFTKVELCAKLRISRPWFDELLAGRDLYNQDRAELLNLRIKKLVEKL